MRPSLYFVLLMILAVLQSASAAAIAFDPANADIKSLRAALDDHRVTSEQLVLYYLDRIEQFDKQGPHINAIITLNKSALEDARRLDREAVGKHDKSVLYGIPFIAKDNYDTSGIPTSGGSAALRNSIPAENAFILQRLLNQGGVLLGKANMSELAASFGHFGYSSAGGLTLNPFNIARNVSGSSSGSAAAVAADFAPYALGTDTSGSIRGPASVTGLVGMRPTFGLTSRRGIIPLSLSFDTSGALTRTVADQAIVLDAIAGGDPEDAATLDRLATASSYEETVERRTLRSARIGVVSNFRGANLEVDAIERVALKTLKEQGAVLVKVSLPKEFEHLWDLVIDPVSEGEFKPQFERYLRSLPPGGPRTLAQLIEISASSRVADSATPVATARLQALRRTNTSLLTDSAIYIRALTRLIPLMQIEVQTLAQRYKLRAFVFSTMSCPASARFDRADPSYVCYSDDPYKAAYIATVTGFPEISVPAGRTSSNVPVGYSFLGLPHTEKELLSLANAFERAIPPLEPPPLR